MDHHHWTAAGLAAACAAMWVASFAAAAWRAMPAAAKPGAFALSAAVTVLMGVRQMLRPMHRSASPAGLDAIEERLDAACDVIRNAYRAEGMAVPPALDGQVQRAPLSIIRGGASGRREA